MSYYKISTNDKLYFRGTIHVVKAVNDDTIEFFDPCPHCLMHHRGGGRMKDINGPLIPLTDDQQAMLDMAVEAGAYSESLFPVQLWGRPVKSDRKLSHQEKMCREMARVWNNAKAARIKEMEAKQPGDRKSGGAHERHERDLLLGGLPPKPDLVAELREKYIRAGCDISWANQAILDINELLDMVEELKKSGRVYERCQEANRRLSGEIDKLKAALEAKESDFKAMCVCNVNQAQTIIELGTDLEAKEKEIATVSPGYNAYHEIERLKAKLRAEAEISHIDWVKIGKLRNQYGPGGYSIDVEHSTNVLDLISLIERLAEPEDSHNRV